ncbi:MAG: hypothetical protein C0524_01290 [Rhodobacter sp.]|nr:hypothetical protein [Rhodobacter sp.]
MITPDQPVLSNGRQSRLLPISRSLFYYSLLNEAEINIGLRREIDRKLLDAPVYGARLKTWHLCNEGHPINGKRIRRLMRLMG